MSKKKIILGMDRYLASEWVDFSLEIFLASDDEKKNCELLSSQLKKDITGIESARKTTDQLSRLWLKNNDDKKILRQLAKKTIIANEILDYSIFHFGMAMNVFPIMRKTCEKIGILSKSNVIVNKQLIANRVSETYANPSSIPRIVDRVIQTLINWGFLNAHDEGVCLNKIIVDNNDVGSWLVLSLLMANNNNQTSVSDILSNPIKLGIELQDLRNHINQSTYLSLNRELVEMSLEGQVL